MALPLPFPQSGLQGVAAGGLGVIPVTMSALCHGGSTVSYPTLCALVPPGSSPSLFNDLKSFLIM